MLPAPISFRRPRHDVYPEHDSPAPKGSIVKRRVASCLRGWHHAAGTMRCYWSSTTASLLLLRPHGAIGLGSSISRARFVGGCGSAVVRRAGSSDGDPKVWRPTAADVIAISWGKPAKRKGTGSRGVPHRLNDDERVLFDLAVKKGAVEIGGR